MADLPVLRVWLLGGFRVELDGRPVPDAAWRRNRARAVVKVLALEPGHRLHREQVMDLLWPDLDAPAAGANLRKAVHFARAALAPSVLELRNEVLALDATVEADARLFEGAAAAGRLDEAVERYTGDLLPEDRFEPWTDEPRERLRAAFVGVLRDLAAQHEAAGDVELATRTLGRLVATDPLDEDAQRRLMAIHASVGARHLALRQFRQLEAALRDQLGVAPAQETRALFEAIAAGAPPAPAGPAAVTGGHIAAATALTERRLVTVVAVVAAAGSPRAAASSASTRRVLESWGGVALDVDDDNEGGVAAVFGLPVLGEDDAVRAVRAALEVAGSADRRGIGVASGEVTVALDAAGGSALAPASEPARLAHLLAAHAAPGAPLLVQRTARAAAHGIRFGDPITVAGGGSAARAVPALGVVGPDFVGEVAEVPLVGRRNELRTVTAYAEEVAARRSPGLLVIAGSAGLGKSRLLREALRTIAAASPGTRILQGRSLPGGRGGTYGALGDVLRSAAGIALTDRPDAMERRLLALSTAHLVRLSPEDRAATVAALALSAGFRLAGNQLDAQRPDEVSRALAVAWPRFAAGLAASGPTVLALEDLHWASPELLDMVEAIVGRSSGPLLVLATARPDLHDIDPAFGSSVDGSTIALRPLSSPESGDLVGRLAGAGALDAGGRDRILDRAEGNPLFLEQLTAHLRDTGGEGLPDTLQSLLGARLDALAPPDRRVLQEASVVGRSFWVAPLESALPGERIGARLALLERRQFVVRRPDSTLPGHEEYAFRHALLHDVAYRSLPGERRARAHARAGTWLEAIAGDRADEVGDMLAHHFEAAVVRPVRSAGARGALHPEPDSEQARIRAKAVDYLVRAGDAARRRFALEQAVDLHRRALALAFGDADRVQVLEALAEDHDAGFHGDDAAAAYREALAIARRRPTGGAAVARLARKLAWLMAWNPGAFRSSPDPAPVEALIAEGLAARPDLVERGWLLLARGAAARLYRGSEPFGQGSAADHRPLIERIADVDAGTAAGREHGNDELTQAAAHARGMLYGLEGRFDEMLELARDEVARLGDDASNLDRSDALRRLAVGLINVAGDFPTGIDLGRQSRTLAGDLNPHQLLHTLWPIMAGLFQLGRFGEVAALADETVAAFRLEPATECQFVRDGPVIAAAALAMLGRTREARDLAALPGDPLADLSSASAWQARFATLAGRPEVAREIAAGKALEQRTYGPQHAFALVEALEALADWPAIREAEPVARRAVAGNAALAPLVDRAMGRAHLAAGELSAARRLLRRAAAGFDGLGMVVEAARARAALDASAPP